VKLRSFEVAIRAMRAMDSSCVKYSSIVRLKLGPKRPTMSPTIETTFF